MFVPHGATFSSMNTSPLEDPIRRAWINKELTVGGATEDPEELVLWGPPPWGRTGWGTKRLRCHTEETAINSGCVCLCVQSNTHIWKWKVLSVCLLLRDIYVRISSAGSIIVIIIIISSSTTTTNRDAYVKWQQLSGWVLWERERERRCHDNFSSAADAAENRFPIKYPFCVMTHEMLSFYYISQNLVVTVKFCEKKV